MNKRYSSVLFAALLGVFSGTAYAEREPDLTVWEDIHRAEGIEQAVADFEKEYNCTVKVVEYPYVTHIERLRLDGPSGKGPDVLLLPSDKVGAAVVQGLISPIKFMQEEQDRFISSSVTSFMQYGEIFGVPKVVESLILFYNRRLLNVPYSTLEEYLEFSKTKVKEGKLGLVAKFDSLYYSFGVMQPYGAYVFGEDSDLNLDASDMGLSTEGSVKAVKFISKFYEANCIPPQIAQTRDIKVLDSLFSSEKAAAIISGPWAIKQFNDANIDYGVTPLPLLPNGKPMSSFLGVKGYVISTWAKDYDLAESFIHFINQPKYVKQRYEITREIPPLKSVIVDPIVTSDPIANAIAIQASRSVTMPSIPEMSEVWTPINGMLKSIYIDGANVSDSLKNAENAIKTQIESFRSGL